MEIFLSDGEAATRAFAARFAKQLKSGDVVRLFGELGAGKTAFVKGLAEGLGIDDEVVSPTYSYLNVYGDYLYHYDCYRLSCGDDAVALGLSDYFGEENVCVIEWSENVESALPENCVEITIEKTGENGRKITVK
ncbi:MAG: tRNA (adenosine(37)-N6)-threonylcarbamoyltransferase complex ATPase subunit type 1 TsaE [Bacillota bacterium]|nr:MAG: tRNA (adenosine(37)-N6)-threonylcarbamoyltransferase complex ATPase subunit type 1 TsaE [Bacillota bacterium]